MTALVQGTIPDKLYFRIGEVSDIVGVKPYVLRYWESEFPDVRPTKSKSGQRLYKRRDVELLLRIRELLYQERFTINGARKRLKDSTRSSGDESEQQLEAFAAVEQAHDASARESTKEHRKVFLKIRKDLESLLAIIRE